VAFIYPTLGKSQDSFFLYRVGFGSVTGGTTRRLHIIDAAIFGLFIFCITSICDMSEDDTVVWCSDIR
jgi:hypothetical protein